MANVDIINKIKKLLTLADPSRGGMSGEVETAMAMANNLMLKHNIAMSEVSKSEPEIKIVDQGAKIQHNPWKWETLLGFVFEYLCDVKMYCRKNHTNTTVCFIGTPSDTAIAIEMYYIFRKQINANRKSQFSTTADQNAYARGYVSAIIMKAKELKAARTNQENKSQALVFVGKKQSLITQYGASLGLITSKPKAQKLNGLAYAIGHMAGQAADLGFQRTLK